MNYPHIADVASWFSSVDDTKPCAVVQSGFAGDPYPPDEVCRGVAFSSQEQDLSSRWPRGSSGAFISEALVTDSGMGMCSEKGHDHGHNVPLARNFARYDSPPCLPTDACFALEATTLQVGAWQPFGLGNALLDFLHREVVVLCMKVNNRKFTIKAEIFCGSSTINVKLRTYEVTAGTYAVEVQRRQGDSVVFMDLFRKLARFLQRDPCCHSVTTEILPELAVCPQPVAAPVSAEDLWPLIDMALRGEAMSEEFRAELASAFARAAQDGQIAVFLASRSALAAVASLLRAPRQDVSLPAAEAMRGLLRRRAPEALPAIMEVIHDTLRAASTGSAVRQQLALAMAEASHGMEALHSTAAAKEVGRQLAEASSMLGRFQNVGGFAPNMYS